MSSANRHVEFFEVGGNPKHHVQTRASIYENFTFHGIVFVYDVSDLSSLYNLLGWSGVCTCECLMCFLMLYAEL